MEAQHHQAPGSSHAAVALTEAVAALTLPDAVVTPPPAPTTHAATDTHSTSTALPATNSTTSDQRSPPKTAPSATTQRTATDTITWEQVQAIKAEHGMHRNITIQAFRKHTDQLSSAGQRAQAIHVLQAAQKECMTTLAVNHASTVMISYMLAQHLSAASQHQAAVRQWRWVVQRLTHCSELSSRLPDGLSIMAHSMVISGQFADAVPAAQQAYDLLMQRGDKSGSRTAAALDTLLHASVRLGSCPPQAVCQHAEEYLRQCRRDHGQLGMRHFCLGWSLIQCYSQHGQHSAAYGLFPMVMAAAEQLLGRDDPLHLSLLRTRGTTAVHCHKYAQGISLLTNVLHTHKTSLGANHPETVRVAVLLGQAYGIAGRDADAVKVFQTVWPIAKAVLNPREDDSRALVRVFTDSLATTGRAQEAQALILEAFSWGVRL